VLRVMESFSVMHNKGGRDEKCWAIREQIEKTNCVIGIKNSKQFYPMLEFNFYNES
jgi:hypothetical protein